MRKFIIFLLLTLFLIQPVSANGLTAPSAPESAQRYMPSEQQTFADGLWYIVKSAVSALQPELANASGICLSLIAIVLLVSILSSFSESSAGVFRLVVAVVIGLLLLEPTNSLISLGTKAVTELSEYGKLMIPVMSAAVAAQGGATTSAALYTGTILFITLLTTFITRFIIPALYIYLCLCVANCALEQDMLKKVRDFIKWLITWSLKWVLYIFTGYISITGVISGTVDASALKAAKIGISGTVPVVGSILSDAAETILVSAGVMKNTAGVYGIFAVLAVCIGPFVRIGAHYLLLKMTSAVSSIFGHKPSAELIQDFSTGMGFALAMTGTVGMLLLISLVCYMKGMG
ncbi:MAG: stage III sporulation protein AE [Oscillospiraceae bacterium]|nr:stage III sporulation protein AE [Oscillospiraceae bacterium]